MSDKTFNDFLRERMVLNQKVTAALYRVSVATGFVGLDQSGDGLADEDFLAISRPHLVDPDNTADFQEALEREIALADARIAARAM